MTRSTEVESWVTVEPRVKEYSARGGTLHRAGCRYVRRARADSVFAWPGEDEQVSADWAWRNGTGFGRACRVCCPDIPI